MPACSGCFVSSTRLFAGPKGPRSFQDERYSYVVLRRGPRPSLGHHTLLTPNAVLPVETRRRMRNVVVGGADEDDLSLANVIASYEAPALGQGDWDAGMAEALDEAGAAWLSEAAAELQQQDAAFSTVLLEKLKHAVVVRVAMDFSLFMQRCNPSSKCVQSCCAASGGRWRGCRGGARGGGGGHGPGRGGAHPRVHSFRRRGCSNE